MYKYSKIAFNFSLCFSLIFTAFTTAQEIEEVVVTATKQEKSVQDIPVSIEAFTSSDIDKNMIDDIIALYLDKLKKILIMKQQQFPIFIFEKPNKGCFFPI